MTPLDPCTADRTAVERAYRLRGHDDAEQDLCCRQAAASDVCGRGGALNTPHEHDAPGLPIGMQLGLFEPAAHDVNTYLVDEIFDEICECAHCGAREIYVQREPYARGRSCTRLGAYCVRGDWVGWINKHEEARINAQQQDQIERG